MCRRRRLISAPRPFEIDTLIIDKHMTLMRESDIVSDILDDKGETFPPTILQFNAKFPDKNLINYLARSNY